MRSLLALVAAGATLAAAAPAAAQSLPACPPGASKLRTSIRNAEGLVRPARATHEIQVVPNFDDLPSEGVVTWSGPPGITQERGSSVASFVIDTPGPVQVTGTWTSSYESGDEVFPCTATKALTVDVLPAPPPGFFPPRGFGGELAWNVRFNAASDLRPVKLTIRGVRSARRPGRGATKHQLTIISRAGDRGTALRRGRTFLAGGWAFYAARVGDRIQLKARPGTPVRRGALPRGIPAGLRFGLEVTFTQAGRLLGRTIVTGSCGADECRPRIRTKRGPG